MSKNFTALVSKQSKYLYKVRGDDAETGRKAWWILRVKPEKSAIFTKIIEKGHLRLTDYGEILESGFGEQESVKILEKYGFK